MAATIAAGAARAVEEGRGSGPQGAASGAETDTLLKRTGRSFSRSFDQEYQPGLNEKQLKNDFIKKVYGILSAQILVTTGVAAAVCFNDALGNRVLEYMQFRMFPWFNLFVSLVLLISLMCLKDRFPQNFVLLLAFTCWEAIVIGGIVRLYLEGGQKEAVISAMGLTCLIFIVLSLYAAFSGHDFSFLGGFLFVCLIANTVLGLVAWCLGLTLMMWVYNVIGVVIFSGYILYDTDQIVNKVTLSDMDTGNAIIGAIELYLDIINLFLHLLALLGNR